MSIFAERLKEQRIFKGLKAQEMADTIGVKLRGYQYYESGEREPNIEKLIIIADTLGTSIDYLVGRTDQR